MSSRPSHPYRILVCDDEPSVLRALGVALESHGYVVSASATGEQAVARAAADAPDVVLLDLGLPGIDGRETIRRLRAFLPEAPIIILSAWSEDETKVEALDLGADDYIEKPFAMPELLARIRVAIRHVQRAGGSSVESSRLERGDIVLDLATRRALVRGAEVQLTRTQFDLLAAFARHPGRVLTHRALVSEVWGDPDAADPSNLRVFISALRRLIEPDPGHPERIETVAGVGYRFLPGGRVVHAAGVVLAGGRSLRMGTSKAWLDWHGTTLLGHVAAIVSRAVHGGPLVVVSAVGQQLPALPAEAIVVADEREALGPLQGIATGLAALEGIAEVAFVSSTDAALLHPRFVQRVLAGIDPDVDAVVPHARGHRQPLAAAYRVELAPLIDTLLEQGRARPASLFERARTRFVDDDWLLDDHALAAVDPALASLENLNDPAAYAAALALPAPTVTVAGETSGRRAFTLGELASSLGLELATTVRVNDVDVPGDPEFPLATGDAITFRD